MNEDPAPLDRRVLHGALARLRANHLVHNSAMLLLNAGATAVLGFAFWVVVAHLYSPADIGLATSLTAAVTVLSYFSLFGLNGSLIRFLPSATHRNELLTQAMLLVSVVGLLLGAAYVVGIPWYAPDLAFVHASPLYSVAFVVCAGLAAVNLVTDSVFIAARQAQYNAVVDGLLQGVAKLAMPALLLGLGSYGIFGAAGVGWVVAVSASVWFMRRVLGFRFSFTPVRTALVDHWQYSVASYVSSALNLAPIMIVPVVVLNVRGAAEAGFYALAFQLASLLYAASFSVSEAVFAEGSHDESALAHLFRRAARLMLVLQAPASAVVYLASGLLLSFFGAAYEEHARTLLQVFALGGLAVVLNSWAGSGLRILRRMSALIWSNAIYCAVVVGLSLWWAERGLMWVGLAWALGNLAAGGYGTWWVIRAVRRDALREHASPPFAGNRR